MLKFRKMPVTILALLYFVGSTSATKCASAIFKLELNGADLNFSNTDPAQYAEETRSQLRDYMVNNFNEAPIEVATEITSNETSVIVSLRMIYACSTEETSVSISGEQTTTEVESQINKTAVVEAVRAGK